MRATASPPADIRRLEELSLNAWPSLRQSVYDGWLLRFAGGYTRRANSVQPLYPGTVDLHPKIAACERAYAAQRLPAIFKMTAAAVPLSLDQVLSERGYLEAARTSVQTRTLEALADLPPRTIELLDGLTPRWFEAFTRFSSTPPAHVELLRQILTAILPMRRFAAVMEDGEVCACGLAVVEHGWAGLFDIVTRLDRRRCGLGTAVAQALLHWARDAGATAAYLQVMLDNAPALSLYAKLGFQEAYPYWYRVRAT